MNEAKIINDPVFGFIKIPRGLLYDIVKHPLMQRLTRIKQLGMASVVYPGAQHTRFQHSLGAFYLMSEAIQSLTQKGIFIFELKVDEPVDKAFKQIREKKYAEPYLADGRPIWLIGLSFDSKTRHLVDCAAERC